MNNSFNALTGNCIKNGEKQNIAIDFVLSIVLWIVVFDVPIIASFNVIHVFGFLSILLLIASRRIYLPKGIIKIFCFCCIWFVWTVFVLSINGVGASLRVNAMYFIIDLVPFSICFSMIMERKGYDFDDLIRLLIIAGCIESATVLASLLNSKVHQFFINKMLLYFKNEDFFNIWSFRLYGFASNLQYSSALSLSFIGLLSFYKGLQGKKVCFYFLLSVLMLVCAYVNARTSLILFLCGMIALAIKTKKNIVRVLVGVGFIFILMLIVLRQNSSVVYSKQREWLADGISDIFSLFSSKYYAHYSAIKYFTDSSTYLFPTKLEELLFGTGLYPMMSERSLYHSDVGFINDIWFGGVFYLSLSIIAICFIWKNIGSLCSDKTIRRVALVTLLVGNVKGICFSYNNLTTIIVIMLVVAIYVDESIRI